jgi:hypothetical protein
MELKKFILKSILILSLIFISLESYCQENFLPGYLIEPAGDTLHGFVDYRNWVRNPDKISFKANLSDYKLEYTPDQIKGFSVSGEIYESAIVETEISPVNKQYLQYDPELHFRTDTAFLQVMFRGTKSLYSYVTKDEKDQFYIWQDTSCVLLIYKRYLVEKGHYNKIYIAEKNNYTGQLSLYLHECQTINKYIENIQYQKNSLDNLFLHYSKCTAEEFDFHRKDDEPRFEVGLLGGLSLTNLKLSGTGYDYLINAGYDLSANISAGIFFDFIRVRNQHKWSWCNEILFTRFKVEGQYYQYFNENNYTTTYTTIALLYQKWNSMVRYKFPAGKLFIFANAGVSNGIVMMGTNSMTQEIKFYDMERTEDGNALTDTRFYELGFVAGIGTKFKKFSFETRFEIGNGFSDDDDLSAITNRYYFLLGYRF